MANFVQNYNGGVQFKTGASQGLTVDINGNLGVGTSSPSGMLKVVDGVSSFTAIEVGPQSSLVSRGTTFSSLYSAGYFVDNGTSSAPIGFISTGNQANGGIPAGYAGVVALNSKPLLFATGNTERMRIDSIGNLGIGVTPSAWYNILKGIENPTGYIVGNTTASYFTIGSNNYHNGTNWVRKSSGYPNQYVLDSVAGGHYWKTATTGVADSVITWTNALTLDASGNLLLTSGTGALGYGTGAGGTVTQLTSKSTAVTLNKPTGKITMTADALAAGASVTFLVNNSILTATDIVYPAIIGGIADATAYRLELVASISGMCRFRLTNLSAGSLSEAVVIQFAVIKGAIA